MEKGPKRSDYGFKSEWRDAQAEFAAKEFEKENGKKDEFNRWDTMQELHESGIDTSRPDGKILSNSELATIEANKDLILNSQAEYNRTKSDAKSAENIAKMRPEYEAAKKEAFDNYQKSQTPDKLTSSKSFEDNLKDYLDIAKNNSEKDSINNNEKNDQYWLDLARTKSYVNQNDEKSVIAAAEKLKSIDANLRKSAEERLSRKDSSENKFTRIDTFKKERESRRNSFRKKLSKWGALAMTALTLGTVFGYSAKTVDLDNLDQDKTTDTVGNDLASEGVLSRLDKFVENGQEKSNTTESTSKFTVGEPMTETNFDGSEKESSNKYDGNEYFSSMTHKQYNQDYFGNVDGYFYDHNNTKAAGEAFANLYLNSGGNSSGQMDIKADLANELGFNTQNMEVGEWARYMEANPDEAAKINEKLSNLEVVNVENITFDGYVYSHGASSDDGKTLNIFQSKVYAAGETGKEVTLKDKTSDVTYKAKIKDNCIQLVVETKSGNVTYVTNGFTEYTPETPTTPETPETPVTPETPETPVTPETPETPTTPETPETPTTPETPETPVTPETPETPTTPEPKDISKSPQRNPEVIKKDTDNIRPGANGAENATVDTSPGTANQGSEADVAAAQAEAEQQAELEAQARSEAEAEAAAAQEKAAAEAELAKQRAEAEAEAAAQAAKTAEEKAAAEAAKEQNQKTEDYGKTTGSSEVKTDW